MDLILIGCIVLIFMVTVRHYEKRIERLEHALLVDYADHDVALTSGLYLHRHNEDRYELPFNVHDHVEHYN